MLDQRVDDEDDSSDDWQSDLLTLLAPLLRSYGCGDARIELDSYYDDERFVAYLPLPARLKQVGQALRIGAHASALMNDAELGPLTLQRAVELVRAGFARTLIERPEGPWLEAKRTPYVLKDKAKKWELAKDVTSFANADDGGLIVIGAHTEPRNGSDVIVTVKDIPLDLVDAETYRKTIRDKIRPHIEGLEVRAVEHEAGRGVAFIHIPPQPDDLKPFVVKGVARRGKVLTTFVSIPIRDGEGTAIAHVGDVQELLRAGRWAERHGELPDP
jgi:hypothetical protein